MIRTLADMREAVLGEKPQLKKILETFGALSLAEYFGAQPYGAPEIPPQRKIELLEVFEGLLAERLDRGIAHKARLELANAWYVSTADHHGPLTHPFFSNSALTQSYVNRAQGRSCVLVLPCAGISLDNSSFPRGVFLHDEELREVRLHLLSRKNYHTPVYAQKAYTKDNCISFQKDIDQSSLRREMKKKLTTMTSDVYESSTALAFSSYCEQITYTNFHFWKLLPGQSDVDLVYLEQETLVASLLLKHHLDADTILSKLLFDTAWQIAYLRHYDGITGAFDTHAGKGTVFFWAIEKGRRIGLSLHENTLINSARDVSIALTPRMIAEKLADRSLMPSMALSFIVLAFYYGLSCGGGFSQVNYLSDMKNAYRLLLQDMRIPANDYSYLSGVRTDFFSGEYILATLDNTENAMVSATPFDLMLYQTHMTADSLYDLAARLPLGTAIDAIMPELYAIVSGEKVGKPDLSSYTACIHVDNAT